MKRKSLTIQARTSELHTARTVIAGFIGKSLDTSGKGRVVLAIDEALSNIMIHGYGNDTPGEITIDMETDGQILKFMISDNAPHFNPLEVPPPDIRHYLDSGKTGGLGVDIYKNIMDVSYERKETGGNRLIMVTLCKRGDKKI